MNLKLHIIPADLLKQYKFHLDNHVQENFDGLHDSELSMDTFSFYTSVSAVFSSKIEGENIDLDSYIKHKRFAAHFSPDYTRKIDDLYGAYLYAGQHKLNGPNLFKALALLTNHILHKARQGKIRTGNMFVVDNDGRIEFAAATADVAKSEMKKLITDLKLLEIAELDFKEVLFFAAMIHLVFVKIHPFEDGNGRTARLLEKWFIAQKLGPKAWFIQSERNYYTRHKTYYNNLRRLGLEYETLDYTKALPFLLMLPQSIIPQT